MRYSLIVFSKTGKSEEIASILAPFKKGGKGEVDDKYLKFVDRDKAEREAYEKQGAEQLQTPDGRFIWTFSKEAKELPPDEMKKHILVKRAFKEIYPTLEDYLKDWNGLEADKETGLIGFWYNPNAKWDLFTIGGIFANSLSSKTGERGNTFKLSDLDRSDRISDENYYRRLWDIFALRMKPKNTKTDKAVLKANPLPYKPSYYTQRWKTKENFVKMSIRFACYAFVYNGEFVSKSAKDDKFGSDSYESEKAFYEKLDKVCSLSLINRKDEYVTIVDCQI